MEGEVRTERRGGGIVGARRGFSRSKKTMKHRDQKSPGDGEGEDRACTGLEAVEAGTPP